MNRIRYGALDVHRKGIRCCIRNADNKIELELNLGTTREEILAFAREHLKKEDVLALEATFNTWAIVDLLAPYVSRIVVSNPLATKAIAQSKIKTDKVDARVLSELLRCGYLPEVWIPDAATRELRARCARRAALVSDLVRIKNRIHGVLAKNLVPRPKGEIFDAKGRAWLCALDLAEGDIRQIRDELRQLDLATEQLEEHDRILVVGAWDDPRVKLLITIPGVDVTVALSVLSALGDITRFRGGDRAASYLGLVPSTRQSGEHCYRGPITKRGNRKARWLLIQAAQHLANHPGPLGVFFRRLARRKNRNVAVVAAARKLAVIARAMLTHGEPYRYALPSPTQNKLSRFRVRATGAKRKTGLPKGKPRSTGYGSGVRRRTIPALPQIYADEGLPKATPPRRLKAAEKRVLKEQKVDGFVDAIQTKTTVARKRVKRQQLRRFPVSMIASDFCFEVVILRGTSSSKGPTGCPDGKPLGFPRNTGRLPGEKMGSVYPTQRRTEGLHPRPTRTLVHFGPFCGWRVPFEFHGSASFTQTVARIAVHCSMQFGPEHSPKQFASVTAITRWQIPQNGHGKPVVLVAQIAGGSEGGQPLPDASVRHIDERGARPGGVGWLALCLRSAAAALCGSLLRLQKE